MGELREGACNPNLAIVLVGTKRDLADDPVTGDRKLGCVTRATARRFAAQQVCIRCDYPTTITIARFRGWNLWKHRV